MPCCVRNITIGHKVTERRICFIRKKRKSLWLKEERAKMSKLSLLLILFSCSLRALTEGQLDTSFNPTGTTPGTQTITETTLGATVAGATKVVTASNGVIYQLGNALIGGVYKVILAKYTRDGVLDTTFNSGGSVPGTTTPLRIGSTAAAVDARPQLLSNGKILAAGYAGTFPVYSLFIARYNADGTLDTTFNSSGTQAGVVTQNFSTSTTIYDMRVQSDGKIVLAGGLYDGSNTDLLVARYTSAGVLDTATFGSGNGYITKRETGWTTALAYSLAIQSNGRIVIGGYAVVGGNYRSLVARFTSTGSYDTTFNSTGYNLTDITQSGAINVWNDIDIQSDGKIVSVGYSGASGARSLIVARYLSTGALDSTGFNASGTTLAGTNSLDVTGAESTLGYGITLQADSKIIAAGYLYDGSNHSYFCARYATDGTLDTTFNAADTQAGVINVSFGSSVANDICYGTTMQPDGRIILSGNIEDASYSPNGFGIARVIGLPVVVPVAQETDADSKVSTIGLGTGWVTKAKSFYALLREKYYDWS